MKKILKNRILVFIIVFILLLTACSRQASKEQEKPVIKIGYLPITHAAPLLLDYHNHEGKFTDYEIELVKFSSWPDLMDALNAGRIDGASVLIQLAMKAKEKGIDLKAVALGHQDGNVLISGKDIHDVQDLQGETFAIPHTYSTHHLLLNELLMLEDMAYEDVEIVELPPPEMPAALAEERIAGYVVAEPFGALAVHLNIGKVLAFSEEFWPNSYCCVLVLRNDFMTEYPHVTEIFIDQYVEAGLEANEKGSNLYDALKRFMNVDDETLQLSLEWISFDSLTIEEAEYEKMRDRVIQLGLMENPPSYESFVDNSFIDRTKAK